MEMKFYFSVILLLFCSAVFAGPYTEEGVNGFIGSDFRHANPIDDSDAVINPIFRGWATGYKDYLPSDEIGFYGYNGIGSYGGNPFYLPEKTLGPVTGDHMDIVSLGDLDNTEIADGGQLGQVTLIFGDPCEVDDVGHIRNVSGYDFVVFENGFISNYTTGEGTVAGQMFSELGYVEVSSDGHNFVRFPSVSLTPQPTGSAAYLTVDITDLYNLVGKHPNAYGVCTGTAFDLAELSYLQDVQNGTVDINNISYVRIVDIAGSGDFYDEAMDNIDPCSRPDWDFYTQDNPIYDAWVTWGSGGLDLEAIGVLNEQQYSADINLDGIVDIYDLYIFASSWLTYFGQSGWVARCDLAEPKNLFVNFDDFVVFANQWQQVEQWRSYSPPQ